MAFSPSAGRVSPLTGGDLDTVQDIQTTSTPQFAKVKTAVLFPTADSTTALQLCAADGPTSILNLDTTNKRIGVLTDTPSYDLSLEGESANRYIGLERRSTADSSGRNLYLKAGGVTVGASYKSGGYVYIEGRDARLMNLQLRKEAIDKETERCLKEAPDANSR